ncbi:MAG: tetratricopeptide repeat protein [Alistipes sp.]|nr:tetratricopeptide repeat protein [Alistipes sp.]
MFLTIILLSTSLSAQEEQAVQLTAAGQVSEQTLWEQANAAYNSAEYAQAQSLYEAIAAKGLQSAPLYYNMANAYFKQDDLAHAILYYHRALRLAPADEDIRHNLEYAQQSTKDIIDEIPEFFLTTWMRSLRDVMGGNAWTILSLLLLVASLSMAIVYLLAQRLSVRKVGFYLMAVCGILFIVTTAFAMSARRVVMQQSEAVVMSSSVSIKSSPDRSSTELFVLHEGTTVETGDEVDGWIEIRIADGRKGWIELSRIEHI